MEDEDFYGPNSHGEIFVSGEWVCSYSVKPEHALSMPNVFRAAANSLEDAMREAGWENVPAPDHQARLDKKKS